MLALMASVITLWPNNGLQANPLHAVNSDVVNPDTVLYADFQTTPLSHSLDSFSDPSSDSTAALLLNNAALAHAAALSSDWISESSSDVTDDGLETSQETLPQPSPELSPEISPVFGQRGDRHWYVQGGGSTTFFENNFALVGAGLSHFFANGHSVNLELNGMVFEQVGDEAAGLNLALLHRWHFVRQPNWSLYIDGGAGILGTTDDVPSTGSSFNFTPQAGGGATIRLDDEKHMMVGLRWHHISNGDLYEGNPGRDSILGYVGVNFTR